MSSNVNNASMTRSKPTSAFMTKEMLQVTDPKYREHMLEAGPHANQLWLVEQDEHTEYVMIVGLREHDPRIAQVIPMSNDPAEQTATGLIVEKTPLGIPMIAWPSLAIDIPIRLLSVPLGDFDADIAQFIVHNDPTGSPEVYKAEDADDLLETYALYSARMIMFQHWWNIGQHLPPLHQAEHIEFAVSEDRAAYAKALKTVLNMSTVERNAVMNHGMKLTKTQQKKMEKAGFPTTPPEAQEAIPDEYLVAAEQPYWRKELDGIDADGNDVRLEIARKAAFDLAARTDGHGQQAVKGAFRKAIESMKNTSASSGTRKSKQ